MKMTALAGVGNYEMVPGFRRMWGFKNNNGDDNNNNNTKASQKILKTNLVFK